MSVTYVIRFDVVPGRREQFLDLLHGVLDAMRSESTFHEAILHRDPSSDHRFMLYETWESHEEVLNVQLHKPYRRAWHAALPDILQTDRDISVWEPLRVDREGRHKAQP
jgi:(4S)-4-hydroxy-5-phosphonooxypentane-2,3-dione isomerase